MMIPMNFSIHKSGYLQKQLLFFLFIYVNIKRKQYQQVCLFNQKVIVTLKMT